MNPEDRLRDALSARAGAARTSPGALDGVFTKVARHKRNVRAAAAAGAALSVAAVALVANAAIRPERQGVVVTSPSPTASASTSPSPEGPPAPRAAVLLHEGRIAEIDTRSGSILRTVEEARHRQVVDLAYSQTRHAITVVLDGPSCDLVEFDLDTGTQAVVGTGSSPAYSPDGTRLAVAACGNEGDDDTRVPVKVIHLNSRGLTTYWPEEKPADWPAATQHMDSLVGVGNLTWLDDRTFAVQRGYEEYVDTILVDTRTDDSLADGARIEEYVSFAWQHRMYGLDACCPPEYTGSTTMKRVHTDRAAEPLFEVPNVKLFAVDGSGALLYVTPKGDLWRWDGWEDARAWDSGGERTQLMDDVARTVATS